MAAVSEAFILSIGELATAWSVVGLLPLLAYLAYCYFRARKMILAEPGRERDIVRLDFVAMAADRSARFWGFLFAIIAVSTCVTTLAIWAYQAWLWHRESDWIAVTWLSVVGVIPQSDYAYLQRLFYWLGDTNIGVVVLIVGLLIAAPLVAVHHQSNHKAKLRRRDLVNLKKRS